MTKDEALEARETELKRWQEQQAQLQQEYARQLGIHQGRMSIIEEQLVEDEETAPIAA